MDTAMLAMLAGAVLLGLRHGLDWDHIAAILDIAGTANPTPRLAPLSAELKTLKLSMAYSFGHALVVFLLGIAALKFAAVLPGWVDPIVRRLTGVTLLLLSLFLLYSLRKAVREGTPFHPVSRWTLVLTAAERGFKWLLRSFGIDIADSRSAFTYQSSTAFGIGMIHAIGAETGTQVLLLASVAGVANQQIAYLMLVAFAAGLIVSNLFLAWCSITGLLCTASFKPVYLGTGLAFAMFSLVVGTAFVTDMSDWLPDLLSSLPPSI